MLVIFPNNPLPNSFWMVGIKDLINEITNLRQITKEKINMREEKEIKEKTEEERKQKEFNKALIQTVEELISINKRNISDLCSQRIITSYNIDNFLTNIKNNLLTIKFLKQNINQ